MSEGGNTGPADGAPGGKLMWFSLAALCASIFSFAVAFGGLIPLMALVLEARSVDGATIGLVVAAQPLGTIVAAPFVPRLLRRLGAVNAILVCGVISLLTVILLPLFVSVPAWMALRLIAGLAGAGPWIILETWINVIATERDRARIIAIYVSMVAAGFAAGPVVLSLSGTDGVLPFIVFAVLSATGLLPIAFLKRAEPVVEVAENTQMLSILRAAPVLFAAAIVAGVVDIVFFSFLPIWGIRSGLEEWLAVLLLSVFVSGNIVLQYPLGWLADTLGYRSVLLGCAVVCVAGPLVAPGLLVTPVILGMVLFIWGGCAWALYSISLAELGQRFRGGTLAAANSVFVIAYEVANVAGPPAAGAAIDIWPDNGLMGVTGVVAVCFIVLLAGRSLAASSRSAPGE